MFSPLSKVTTIIFATFYLLSANEPCPKKRGHNAIAKGVNSCQPAPYAQADVNRNFLLSPNFMDIEGLFYLLTQLIV